MNLLRRIWKFLFGWRDDIRDILFNQETIMGQLEDLAAALDAETTAVANELDTLKTQLAAAAAAAGQAPDPATMDKLTAISARLKALASDPANPVPATPVVAPAAPAASASVPPAAPVASDTPTNS